MRKKTSLHRKVVCRRAMACLVAAVLFIGMVPLGAFASEEHTHNQDGWTCQEVNACGHEEGELVCGEEEGALICGETEQEPTEAVAGHSHDEGCYDDEGALTCGLEEGEGAVEGNAGHQHDGSCTHQHSDVCYHTHSDGCFAWECTAPESGQGSGNTTTGEVLAGEQPTAPDAGDTRPENLELLEYLINKNTILTLGGKEIEDGATIKEGDLIGNTLEAKFEFDLPLGDPSFEEGKLVSPGTPQEGDTITFALDPLFSTVSDSQVEAIPFEITDSSTGTTIEAGAARFVNDGGAGAAVVLTFNDEIGTRKWESLDKCHLAASLQYEKSGSGSSTGKEEVTIFTKTIIIEKENEAAMAYKLEKRVVKADGSPLGANDDTNVVYSQAEYGQTGFSFVNENAITKDGQITWEIKATALESANLKDLTLRDIPGAKHTIVGAKINGTALEGEDLTEFIEKGYTFESEETEATLLVTTQIDDKYWRVQNGASYSEKRTLANTARLMQDDTMLLEAGAKVSFCPKMLVKYMDSANGSLQGTFDQLWHIQANSAGVKVENAYIVDTFNAQRLSLATDVDDWLKVKIGRQTYKTIDLVELASKPVGNAVEKPSYFIETGKITIYLGTITETVDITLRTTVKKSDNGYSSVRNNAQLFGKFGAKLDMGFGNDYEDFSRPASTMNKKGVFSNDTIRWTVTADSKGYKWADPDNGYAFICDFIVSGTEIPDALWNDFEQNSGLTKEEAALVKEYYTDAKYSGSLATGQTLKEEKITFRVTNGSRFLSEYLTRNTLTDENGGTASYIVAKIPASVGSTNVVLEYKTTPTSIQTTEKSTWKNHAQLYYRGGFRVDAKASVTIGKEDGERMAKTFKSYDAATHTAAWDIVLNKSNYSWNLFYPTAEGANPVLTDTLPEGWQATGVTVAVNGGAAAEAAFTQEGSAVTWEIPSELRAGNAKLTYTVTAVLDIESVQWEEGEAPVVNQATLTLGEGLSYNASCEFTLYNRQPGKSGTSKQAKQITWTLQVNEAYYPYNTASVEDTLPEGLIPMGTIDDGNAFIPTVSAFYLKVDAKGKLIKGAAVAEPVKASYNSVDNRVTIQLPEPGKGYWLEFTTQIIGAIPAAGFENTAKYIANATESDTESAKLAKAQIAAGGGARQLGSLTITKKDGQGALIDGAVFRLRNLVTDEIREATTHNGALLFDYVPVEGAYKLEEVLPAPGFAANGAFNSQFSSFTLNELAIEAGHPSDLNIKLDCVNTAAANTVAFAKIDRYTQKALSGVGFTLSSTETLAEESVVKTAESNIYGYVTFPGLAPGNYYLFETKPLAGYEQPEGWLLAAAIGADGAVTYQKPDGTTYTAQQMMNGVAPVIENTKSASTLLNGTKTLTGRDLKAGEFTFELHQANPETWEPLADGFAAATTNDANGAFSFKLRYSQDDVAALEAGQEAIFAYLLTERNDGQKGVTYDETIYRLLTKVRLENGSIRISAQVMERGEADGEPAWAEAAAAFHNSYKEDTTPGPGPEPENPGDNPGNEPDDGPDDDTDDGPDEPSREEEEEIPQNDVPLANLPTVPGETIEEVPTEEIIDEEVPLADVPDTELIEEEVPLTNLPKTGGFQGLWLLGLAVAAIAAGAAFRRTASLKR